jgi:hypothetical protein
MTGCIPTPTAIGTWPDMLPIRWSEGTAQRFSRQTEASSPDYAPNPLIPLHRAGH